MKPHTLKNKIFFYLLSLVILIFVILVLQNYLTIIILAFLFAMLLSPVYDFFFKITKKKKTLSVAITSIVVFIAIFIPLVIIINMIISQSIALSNDLKDIISERESYIPELINQINATIESIPMVEIEYRLTQDKIYLIFKDAIEVFIGFFSNLNNILDITTTSADIISKLFLFVLLFISFLPNKKEIFKFLQKISPLEKKINDIYFQRTMAMSESMIKGTFLVALVESMATGIVMALIGVKYVVFLTIIMAVLSIMPYVGVGLISVPIGIVLFLNGNYIGGFILVVIGLFVVPNLDNLMRPILVPKDINIHPLMVILSLVGGIQFFGPIGFIFGPIVMILFQTSIDVYMKHYR